jgi:hypothetical protein
MAGTDGASDDGIGHPRSPFRCRKFKSLLVENGPHRLVTAARDPGDTEDFSPRLPQANVFLPVCMF